MDEPMSFIAQVERFCKRDPYRDRPGKRLRDLYEDGYTWAEILPAMGWFLCPWWLLHRIDARFPGFCWANLVSVKLGYGAGDVRDMSLCCAWAEGHNPGHCWCGKIECEADPR